MLLLNIEVNPRCGAVSGNLLAVEFHFEFRDPRPFQATHCLGRFAYGILRSLRKTLFGGSNYLNYFLHFKLSPLNFSLWIVRFTQPRPRHEGSDYGLQLISAIEKYPMRTPSGEMPSRLLTFC
jgi:hypothetical protein